MKHKGKSVKSQLTVDKKSFRKIKKNEKFIDWLTDMGVKEQYRNDIENIIERISHETSGAREQKLMDKLSDLSVKIGNEYKNVFKTKSDREYLTDMIFDSMSTFGEFENGGKTKQQLIPNNYKGKTAKQIWNGWTQGQRLHFLEDHHTEFHKLMQDDVHEFATDKYDHLDSSIIKSLKKHISMGEYEDGGKLAGHYKITVARNMENELVDILKTNKINKEFIEYENDGGMDVAIYEVEIKTKPQYDLVKRNVQTIKLQRADGGKLNSFFNKAKDLAKKGADKTKAAYEKAKPHVQAAAKKTADVSKKAYDTAKQTVKQKIHNEKKKVAIDVLKESSNLGGLDSKEKSELSKAKNIVQDNYEDGGKTEKVKKCPTGTKVQTLLLSKDRFKSEEDAKGWAHSQGFKFGSVDSKPNTWRLRQEEPSEFKKDSFRTITMTTGVKATIGCPAHGHATVKSKLAAENGGTYKAGGKITGLKAAEIAGEMMELDFDGYTYLGLESFPTDDMDLQRAYYKYILEKLNAKFKKYKGKLTHDVYSELEGSNHHSVNSVLVNEGWYDKSVKYKGLGSFDKGADKNLDKVDLMNFCAAGKTEKTEPVKERKKLFGVFENGGKSGDIKDEAVFTYTKFLERCLEYFDKFDPLNKTVKEELELVRHKDKSGVEHAIRYYHDKTKHKAEIFTHAGADELAEAFMKASRKAEDKAWPI